MRTNPEALLISAVIRTGDIGTAIRQGASPRIFHTYNQEWLWLETTYDRTRRTPSRATFKAQFPEFKLIKTDDVSAALELVKSRHARQCTHAIVEEAAKLIEDGKEHEAVAHLSLKTRELQYQLEHNADAVDVVDNWEETLADVRVRHDRAVERGQSGIPTSIRSIDTLTGGLQEGWLTVLAARLGVGKTWTMIRMAYGAVSHGYDALYFSLEQSRHQIAMRMQGLAANDLGYQINPAKLAQGVGVDLDLYEEALDEIQASITGKFLVNDSSRGRVTTSTVEAAIEAKQPDIVFIDYLTLLRSVQLSGRGDSPWIDVGRMTAELKVMAEQYRIPIVVASQINRSGGGADPGAENLSQSDSIGQDADMIITIVRKTDHVRRLKIIKNRHGPDGVGWFMHFDPSEGIYEEVTGNRAEAIVDKDLDVD